MAEDLKNPDTSCSPPCDEELVAQCQQGNIKAFDELLNRFQDRIYRFVRSRVNDQQDAEDITQQAFVKAYHNIDRFNPNYRFSTWIFTIARRLVISHYRASRPHDELDDHHPAPCAAHPGEGLDQINSYNNVWHVAKQVLPEAQMTVLWLKYHEDLSVKEIAAIMDKTNTHVKVMLHRGRNKLSKTFDVHGQRKCIREDTWNVLPLLDNLPPNHGDPS